MSRRTARRAVLLALAALLPPFTGPLNATDPGEPAADATTLDATTLQAAARDDDPDGAESDTARPQNATRAEVTVVATRLRIPTEGVTVRTLTREEISRIGARSFVEVLRWLPGLDVRRRGVDGIQADIGIRGADYNGTLILVDGEPVNDPQTNHLSSDLDVPLDAIERIEVLYGAGAALYGSGAVGGVIQIVTRGSDLGRARAQFEGRYSHGTHSTDSGSLRVAAWPAERFTVAVDADRVESSGFREDTEYSATALRLSSRLETGRGPISLSLGYAGRRYGAFAFYGTRLPNQQETTRTRTARLYSELSFGAWTVSPSLSFRAHADDFVLERTNPAFYENLHDADQSAARVFARRTLFGGSLALGAEAGRDSIASTNLGSHRRDRSALFLEFGRSIGLGTGLPTAITAGLRLDLHQGFGTRLSPHASIAQPLDAIARGLRLRASIGTAFRVPTFTDLYYSDPQNAGNPNLAAERATNVEAGAALTRGDLTLDAVYFFRHATNLIDYVRPSSTERYQARNVRSADTHGLEATVDYRVPGGSAPVRLTRISLGASYTFVDLDKLVAAADGATEGKYVLDPLHTKWDLALAASLPYRTSLTSHLSYFSRPSFKDGVWLLEARLGTHLMDADILEAYVEGENLGNVRYEERPGVPLPRRLVTAGLRLTW